MVAKATGLEDTKPVFYILLTAFISILWMATAVQAGACENAAMQLRGGFEVTQSRGGIWGYMEKATSLKKDSMLGFQIGSQHGSLPQRLAAPPIQAEEHAFLPVLDAGSQKYAVTPHDRR